MEETPEPIDELIGKVLAGEASPGEQAQVDAWILEAPDRASYFEQMKSVFDNSGLPSVQHRFDSDAAWQKVRRKIKREHVSIPGTRWIGDFPAHFTGLQMLGVAASMALIVFASYAVYQWTYPKAVTREVISTVIMFQDTLPDGSKAFLNKKTRLSFEYNPRQKTRRVKLKGEAFFEVKHEEEKPFIIETDSVLIKDLGTAFNVRSYPDSPTVEVIVESGEVHLYTLRNPGIDLFAGEKGIYNKKLREFTKTVRLDTNVLSYKTKVFSFNNTDLRSVVLMLNEVYNIRIKLSTDALGRCRLTVNFNNESIDSIVEVLSETLSLKVTRRDGEIILEGPGCDQ